MIITSNGVVDPSEKIINDKKINDDLSDVPTCELIEKLPSYFNYYGKTYETTYLNWRFYRENHSCEHFEQMANGYLTTAISLLDQCILDNHDAKADIWIFPILQNVIHSIELYLKMFIAAYGDLITYENYLKNGGEIEEAAIPTGHNIKQLCEEAQERLRVRPDRYLQDTFNFIEKFIEILYSKTSNMDFARYPTDETVKITLNRSLSSTITADYTLKLLTTELLQRKLRELTQTFYLE